MKRRRPHLLASCVVAAVLPLVASCAGDQSPVAEQPAKDVFAARWPSEVGTSFRPQPLVTATPQAQPETTGTADAAKPLGTPPAGNRVQASLQSPASGNIRATPQVSHGLAEAKTEFARFATAPFPYSGSGLTLPSGRVLRGGRSYTDDRVLMHIPAGFDISQPSVMVVFFHGHRAELERDVLARQQVPAQISMSGTNAVLVAPQFAVDAADSDPGRFGEPGGFARFIAESGKKLARLYGDPKKTRQFETMPVVLVAYSGGYLPAAVAIGNGGLGKRLRGVVLLDALYGEHNAFASWIRKSPTSFFISAYTSSTRRHNQDFARALEEQGIRVSTTLEGNLWRGGRVAILATDDEANHRDFVTRAWTENPITDVLTKLN